MGGPRHAYDRLEALHSKCPHPNYGTLGRSDLDLLCYVTQHEWCDRATQAAAGRIGRMIHAMKDDHDENSRGKFTQRN